MPDNKKRTIPIDFLDITVFIEVLKLSYFFKVGY